MVISSKQNTTFKYLIRLLNTHSQKKEPHYLIFGKKVINECIENHSHLLSGFILSDKMESFTLPPTTESYIFSNVLYKEIDIFGTNSPIAIVKKPTLHDLSQLKPVNTLYCPLGDPMNLGGLLRSAAAFQFSQIVLLKEAANPFLPKSIRAMSGSQFHLNFFRGPSLSDLTVDSLFVLDKKGDPINHLSKADPPISLLIGQEGLGHLNSLQIKSKKTIAIPQQDEIESLNATIAGSIAMSYFYNLIALR